MGKRGKGQKPVKSDSVSDGGEEQVMPTSDDDEEEANEDLSLKIVEKAMALRACSTSLNDALPDESNSGVGSVGGTKQNDVVLVGLQTGSGGDDIVVSGGSIGAINLKDVVLDGAEDVTNLKNSKKRVKKKSKNIVAQDITVDVEEKEEKAETVKGAVIDKSVEANPVDTSVNEVLRKLLRGPRYFDPPDSGWGTCYNCGEEGHTTVNCTSAKRKKPCFICGSLEHNAKQCAKGQDCFICKKGGHRAKDCPEKHEGESKSSKICLKCGESGHDFFSCKNDYSHNDLKEIRCYVCKSYGHLCCVNQTDPGPRELSCYRCGQSGHTGSACGSRREKSSVGSLSSCYKCGEEGHFARECTSVAKRSKRNRELSTPKQRFPKESREYLETRSVPQDLVKARKVKKRQYEEGGFTSSAKSKQRGGWITDDPGNLPRSTAKVNDWRSPATPADKGKKTSNLSVGGLDSSNHSFKKPRKLYFGNSTPNGSAKFYQHRFSASRFGNSSNDGMRRNYGW